MASLDMAAVSRGLNKVKSAGQTRAAIGAALNALHDAYGLLSRIGDASTRQSSQRGLDSARGALEAWYKSISTPATADYTKTYAQKRNLIERAYVEVAGVEGAAGYEPQTSVASILERSIVEAPGLVLKQATKAVSAVGAAAGEAVGATAGGLFSGLGIGGVLTVAVIIVIVLKVRGVALGGLIK